MNFFLLQPFHLLNGDNYHLSYFFIAWSLWALVSSPVKWNVDEFCDFFWALLWYRYWKYIWRFLPICQLKPLNDTSNTSQGAISSSKRENWLKVFVYDAIFLYHLSRLPFPLFQVRKKQLLEEGVLCIWSHVC